MKSHAAILLLVSLLCRNAVADGDNLSVPHIAVNGTATTEVVPDRLHWAVTAENTGLDLPKVAELHSKKVAAVLETLKANGIPDKDVQTSQMEFSENQVHRNSQWIKEGYKASTRIAFKHTELTKYHALWLALAALSDVSVNGVAFDHTDRIKLNRETRVNALKAAKEKAEAMAEVLGAKVGEPLAVQEDPATTQTWWGSNTIELTPNIITQPIFGSRQAQFVESLAPGSIPITIRVQVTFRLLNEGK